ncbi:tectonin beta-propeller repeat-containing protein-like [Homalodisca vitripennis]|nr:tectonin beta-propeller repeat-containing protein-like [Homalodisca vitripennis]
MPSSMLFAVNNEGKIFGLSTNGTKWREFQYLGLEFKQVSAVPNFLWAVGSDRQIYVHAHGLDIPIRIKEETYENQRWSPIHGFGKHMLPTDRFRWSTKDGLTERRLDQIRLPSMAWQWEGDWHIETTLDGQQLDDDGWTYAVDFPATYHSQKQWSSCVRRRKWVRYRRYAAINSWCAIAPLHKDPTQEPFIDVSIGGTNVPGSAAGSMQVWAVTAYGRVMWRSGVSRVSPEGVRWNCVTMPPGCDVINISCGSTGLVWAIMFNGRALVRGGVTGVSPTGSHWLEVAAPEEGLKLTRVSVGTHSVWAISNDHRVWWRKGVRGGMAEGGASDELARGSGWVEMVGGMAMVSVATNDQVFGVGSEDRTVYYRAGVTAAEMTGRRWRPLYAATQYSRASSCASLPSGKHNSTSSLNRNSLADLTGGEETSHSAPVSLRFTEQGVATLHRQCGLASLSAGFGERGCRTTHPREQSEVDLSRRSVRAWSPVRSVGSVLGVEAVPTTDADRVLDPECEREAFRERDSPDPEEPSWSQATTVWLCVEAGAVTVDPQVLPNWFHEGVPSGQFESAPWRSKILADLKIRHSLETSTFEKYELAVEMASWVKTGECRCCLPGTAVYDDCILELEWVGSQAGCLDSGTLSVLTIDKAHTRAQLSLGEVVCVSSCSEPGNPRLAVHTLRSAATRTAPLRLQFCGDVDHDDWLANLTSVCCQMMGLEGSPKKGSIWITSRLGEVFSFDPSTFQTAQQRDGLYCHPLDVRQGTSWLLSNGFPPGSRLVVNGSINDRADRFNLDLVCESVSERTVAFHFNPRFLDRVVVRNSMTAGQWDSEEREGALTLSPSCDFCIEFLCQEDGYKVIVNGMVFTYFEHRHKPQSVTHLEVNGDCHLHEALYYTKKVIIPMTEMFWRPMGGHLQRVETCENGVTWGVGSDNTPWAYSGGWGGSVLGGLERTMAGVHPMTDTYSFYLYENQRWNPLSGFTTRGLPTDRPMWSDSTGRIKRSKETTRLLSMHWQWVGDWAVDYHTPGGVDKDGWQYAVDFPRNYHANKQLTDYVRRRRWVRRCRLTTSGPWLEVGNTKIADLSLQSLPNSHAVSVWAVGANGDALYRKNVTVENPMGDSWEHVACDQALCSVSCGPHNQVWAIGRNGSTYWRFGITTSNPMGEVWESVEPPSGPTLRQVSVGLWSVWAVNQDNRLFVRKEITSVFPEGTHWQAVTDANCGNKDSELVMRQISMGGPEVWGVTTTGVVCRRLGVTADNPAGTSWLLGLQGNWRHVSPRGFS